MQTANVSDIVRACFSAWENGDRTALDGLLAAHFTFSSPRDDHLSRADYWATCWPGHEMIRSYRILNLVEDGSEAFVRYECTLEDGKRFKNVEHFTFEGDQIAAVEVYFGRDLAPA